MEPRQLSTSHCLAALKGFLSRQRPGLKTTFYNNDSKLRSASVQAAEMVEKLVMGHGYTFSLACQLMVLTLYDLVLLLDDSSSMEGERGNEVKRVVADIATIYSLARPEGINAVKFLNTKQGGRNVTAEKVDEVFRMVKWRGNRLIGTRLQKRVLEPFVLKKGKQQRRPVFVVVIAGGDAAGEDPGVLRNVVKNCFVGLKHDVGRCEDAVVLSFTQIGTGSRVKGLLKSLEDDPEIGQWMNCLSMCLRVDNTKTREQKHHVPCKLLLETFYQYHPYRTMDSGGEITHRCLRKSRPSKSNWSIRILEGEHAL